MKKMIIFLVLLCATMTEVDAQHFKYFTGPPRTRKEEQIYRDFTCGVKVVDETGKELRRTEPVFSRVFYTKGFDLAAVGLQLFSLDFDKKDIFETGHVWVCLDYDLKPVFFFPSNTNYIYKVVDGMFLYSDKPRHHPTVGLVARDGKVIFMAPYDRIYVENGWCIGVKNVTDVSDRSGLACWSIEFKRKSPESEFRVMDSAFKIMLKTPEEESVGLWFEEHELEEEESRKLFEELLQEDVFQRGLNHAVHGRMYKAAECFKESLQNEDPKIVSSAEYNLKVVEDTKYLTHLLNN